MKFAELIQVFPQVIKSNSEIFKLEDLQDLDQTLNALDDRPEAEVVEQVKDWFRNHTEARDALIQFASANRELKRSRLSPASSEVNILQNLFELRQTNKDILKSKNDRSKPGKSNIKQ